MAASIAGGDISYSQYAQLPHALGRANDPESLQKAAQHFESMFIDLWLKSAREATAIFSEGNMLSSNEMGMHQEMLDHEMSVHLSKQGGVGLADVIVRQLQGIPTIDRMPEPEFATAPVAVQPNGQRLAAFDSPEDFVTRLKDVVESVLAGDGQSGSGQSDGPVLPPLGVLSQAALETGWGSQIIADARGQTSHNLFGIKSGDSKEPAVGIASMEFENDRWQAQHSRFKAYPDWQASITDYLNHLKQSAQYADVFNKSDSVAGFAQAIGQSSYATDPGYADKIMSIYARVKQLVE